MPTDRVTAPQCKICDGATEIHGCVDAGRSCEISRGTYMPLLGIPIYYHWCRPCGFLFSVAFDSWSLADFRAKIYNADYAIADPDYGDGSRARENFGITTDVLGQIGAHRVLDYGGGDGSLAVLLRNEGFDAQSWDPVADHTRAIPAQGSFPLVTAFEVFEHTPTPIATAVQALSMLQPGGRLLFSTLVMDELPRQATDHWYIAPRNGHISLHTTASLRALFGKLGWTTRSFTANLHIAER